MDRRTALRHTVLTAGTSLLALVGLAGRSARASSDGAGAAKSPAPHHAAPSPPAPPPTFPSLPTTTTLPPLAKNHAAEVHAVLLQQAEEWSAGNLGAFCGHYADACMFFTPTGVTAGRHEVFSQYRKKYPTGEDMGTLTIDIIDVRASDEIASAALRWTLTWAKRAASERTARGHSLVTLERDRSSNWRIVYDASM